jgi:hypothetical protein
MATSLAIAPYTQNTMTPLKPPRHLKAAGKALWNDIVRQYRIADGAGLALVTTAAEALDRMREAQAAIRQRGALVADRYRRREAEPRLFP